jgi:hypothetical protein
MGIPHFYQPYTGTMPHFDKYCLTYTPKYISMTVITGWGFCGVDLAPRLPYSIKSLSSMDIVHPATLKLMIFI